MGRPLERSDVDEIAQFIHARNAVCSQELLNLLVANHGALPVNARLVEPKPLPPIPDVEIAKAAEMAFPKYINRVSEINRLVLLEFPGMTPHELVSDRRHKRQVLARHIGMYVAKRLTSKSYPEIGRRYGNRDHTSVIFAVHKIGELIKKDEVVAGIVNRVEEAMQIYDDEC